MTGYFAFIPADLLHVSGVIAVVTAGVYLGWHTPELTTPGRTAARGQHVGDHDVRAQRPALRAAGAPAPRHPRRSARGANREAALVGRPRLRHRDPRAHRLGVPRDVPPAIPLATPACPRPLPAVAGAGADLLDGDARGGLARRRALRRAHDRHGNAVSGPRSDRLPRVRRDHRDARAPGPVVTTRDPAARARGRRPGCEGGDEGPHSELRRRHSPGWRSSSTRIGSTPTRWNGSAERTDSAVGASQHGSTATTTVSSSSARRATSAFAPSCSKPSGRRCSTCAGTGESATR